MSYPVPAWLLIQVWLQSGSAATEAGTALQSGRGFDNLQQAIACQKSVKCNDVLYAVFKTRQIVITNYAAVSHIMPCCDWLLQGVNQEGKDNCGNFRQPTRLIASVMIDKHGSNIHHVCPRTDMVEKSGMDLLSSAFCR